MKYRHILAAIDVNEPDPRVAAMARRLAARHGATLSVLTVVRPFARLYGGLDLARTHDFEAQVKQAAWDELTEFCHDCRIANAGIYARIGVPDITISEFLAEHGVDLVIVGGADHAGTGFFLGSTATSLLHRADCDIMAMRSVAPKPAIGTLVVAIEPTADARWILERARDVAPSSASIHVVHVMKPLLSGYAVDPDSFGGEWPLEDIAEHFGRAALDAAQKTVVAAGLKGIEVEGLHGTPSKQIRQYVAKVDADLLVMGSGAHVGPGWMIGSTTHNVLQGIRCDTLIVRRTEKS